MPFPAVKNSKEESQEYLKSIHFSSFEDGRSPDQENVRRCFLRGTLGWLLRKEI